MSNKPPPPPTVVEGVLTYQHDGVVSHISVGSADWECWLHLADRFRVQHPQGTFTVRKEQAGNHRGTGYWRAYRRHKGVLRQVYLGPTEKVNLDRLDQVSKCLCPAETSTSALPAPAETALRCTVQPHRRGKTLAWTLPSFPPLTPLVARESEMRIVCALLRQPDVRLLTLIGTGGVGKTSLARVIATALQSEFSNGACLVSLATLHDDTLVVTAILQALGLQSDQHAPFAVLRSTLQERHLLLVLDNFEQVLAAAPQLVDLLATCPNVKLLVTSRERLNIQGETAVEVLPLTFPDPQHPLESVALANYGAIALFLRQAHLIRPSLHLTPQTAPLISAICRRVDGLPLALELAAARLQLLSLTELLDRLDHRLLLLNGGPQDIPAHQQSLRHTIDWSYQLLSHEEQRLFRVLAVFRNGCTVAAVEAVYGLLKADSTWVVEGITSLVTKHLLYQLEPEASAPRVRMHETLQEYGLETLGSAQELEAAQQAHAAYYLGGVAHQLANNKMLGGIAQIEREYPNLHTALEWTLKEPTNALSWQLEEALIHFWQGHHRLGTGERGHERISMQNSGLPEQSDITHRARLHYVLGMLAWIIGDSILARLHAEEGLSCANDATEPVTQAYLSDLLGQIALDQRQDTQAQAWFAKGLALHRGASDELGSLNALFYLERTLLHQGERQQARAYAQDHLALAQSLYFAPGIIGTLNFLGRVALEEGDLPTAARYVQDSVAQMRAVPENQPLIIAANLQGMGVTLAKLGHLTDAVRLWGAAESLCVFLPEERAFVAGAREAVRATLGEGAYTLAWSEGQTMTLAEALAALAELVAIRQIPSSTTANQRHHQASPVTADTLTPRQMEILRLVAQGLTDAQIADSLVISPRTVNAHLRAVYTKLHISSRHAATYYAVVHGVI